MKSQFSISKYNVSGNCEFFVRNREFQCALYKVQSEIPLTGKFLEEIQNILLRKGEQIFNLAYVSSFSSVYIYDDEKEEMLEDEKEEVLENE